MGAQPFNISDYFGQGKTIPYGTVQSVMGGALAPVIQMYQARADKIGDTHIEIQPGVMITLRCSEKSKAAPVTGLAFSPKDQVFSFRYDGKMYSFNNLSNKNAIYFSPEGATLYSSEAEIPAEMPEITASEFALENTLGSESSAPNEQKVVGEEPQEHQDS